LEPSRYIAKRRGSATVAALVAMGFFIASGTSSAYGAEASAQVENSGATAQPTDPTAPPPAGQGALPAAGPAMPGPVNPALDFRAQAPEQPSVFHRWWFWTAVGAAAAATVVIIVISSRGHAPPSTDLGNQEFQP